MDARFYRSWGLDSKRIVSDFEKVFLSQGYQVQHFGNDEQTIIQLRKGSDFEALLGLQVALTVHLQRTPEGVVAAVGQQQWIDKAAAGTIGMLLFWPLLITAGAGVIQQTSLEEQVASVLDGIILQQQAGVRIEPISTQMWEHLQQQGAPPQPSSQPGQKSSSASAQTQQRSDAPQAGPKPQTRSDAIAMPPAGKMQCANCLEINEADDSYCSRCGKPLGPPAMKRCFHCQAQVKAIAAFCPKCGSAFA